MPAGVVNGYTYCSGCTLANREAQQVFEYKGTSQGKPIAYVPDVGYVALEWGMPHVPPTINKAIEHVHSFGSDGTGKCQYCGKQYTYKYGWYQPAQGENTMSEANTRLYVNGVEVGHEKYERGKQSVYLAGRPRYKIGDRVKFGWDERRATVTGVETIYHYTLKGDDGDTEHRTEQYLEDAPLTPEEAWTRATIDITKKVVAYLGRFMGTPGTVIPEAYCKPMRHDAYVILGGAHIKITDEVKQRVRSIIQQAQQ